MRQKQPNSRYCFVCGVLNQQGLNMAFYDDAPGVTRATYSVPESFQGYNGIVHGGVVAAMLDEAAGRTVMGSVHTERMVVTGKMEIRYRKPVPVLTPLTILGEIIDDKGAIVTASSKITDSHGNLLAEAVVTLVEIPSSLKQQIPWESADWQVYPENEG
jgi:uncharacterized protein (TIGR00369 family)